jgi:hypothetical protein
MHIREIQVFWNKYFWRWMFMSRGSQIVDEKPMQLVYVGTEVQPVVMLSKYADPESIVVTYNGQQVIPCGFTAQNDPYFSHEIYHEDEAGRITRGLPEGLLKVSYREKELEPGPEIFDTLWGIRSYVQDLKTFWDIINNRQLYFQRYLRPRAEYLKNVFVAYGKIGLSHSGRVDAFQCVPNLSSICGQIILYSHFIDALRGQKFNMSFGCDIPNEDSVCSICGKKWTLDNLKGLDNPDYVEIRGGAFCGDYHISCFEENLRFNRQSYNKEVIG